MKRLLPAILILIIGCYSQPKTETLTGDLFFSPFKFAGFYNQPDSLVEGIQTYFDTLTIKTADSDQRKWLNQYKILKDRNLLFQPFVYLRVSDDSVVTLYLDTLDYDKIKIYKRAQLQADKKKVRIQASVTMIDGGLFSCDKLKHVDLVDGEPFQRQKKFKIEDYN